MKENTETRCSQRTHRETNRAGDKSKGEQDQDKTVQHGPYVGTRAMPEQIPGTTITKARRARKLHRHSPPTNTAKEQTTEDTSLLYCSGKRRTTRSPSANAMSSLLIYPGPMDSDGPVVLSQKKKKRPAPYQQPSLPPQGWQAGGGGTKTLCHLSPCWTKHYVNRGSARLGWIDCRRVPGCRAHISMTLALTVLSTTTQAPPLSSAWGGM